MKADSVAVTIFDFLGYFVPGALFVYLFLFAVHLSADLFVSADLLKPKPELFRRSLSPNSGELVVFFVGAYLSGHILSFLSSVTVETYATARYGQPSSYLMGTAKSEYFSPITPVHVLLLVFLWPITVPNKLFGRATGIESSVVRPMPQRLAEALRKKLAARFCSEFGQGDQNIALFEVFSWVHYAAIDGAPEQGARLAHHIALSGFMRATSFLAVLAAWLVGLLSFSGRFGMAGAAWLSSIVAAVTCVILAYISFLAFLKFNRRYAFENSIVFLAVTPKDASDPPSPKNALHRTGARDARPGR